MATYSFNIKDYCNFSDIIKAGDTVLLSGTVYTARDAAHKRIFELLDGGKPYEIPDFRKEEDRVKWENDRLTPYWSTDGKAPTLPCCSVTDYKPTDEQIKGYKKLIGIE